MPEYYFDLETYSPGEKPDPTKDKIITIQYQRLDRDGKPTESLQILTEWDLGSESALLDTFRKVFITENPFDFIPVGINLHGFDLVAVMSGFNRHLGLNLDMGWLRDKPIVDIKPVMVLVCNGTFTGWAKIFGKPATNPVRGWYESGPSGYSLINEYAVREARKFVRAYQYLKWAIPQHRLELEKAVA